MRCVAHSFNFCTWETQKVGIWEFETTLVQIVSPRPARSAYADFVSKTITKSPKPQTKQTLKPKNVKHQNKHPKGAKSQELETGLIGFGVIHSLILCAHVLKQFQCMIPHK